MNEEFISKSASLRLLQNLRDRETSEKKRSENKLPLEDVIRQEGKMRTGRISASPPIRSRDYDYHSSNDRNKLECKTLFSEHCRQANQISCKWQCIQIGAG
jgi:protease II